MAESNRVGRSGRALGIVAAERSLSVSAVSWRDGTPYVRQTACFRLPDGPGLNDARFDPQKVGVALGEFLKKESFISSIGWARPTDVVFGVPARWIWCRGFRLPPADEPTTRQMLWLAANDKLPADLGPFALDYLDATAAGSDGEHFIVGLPRATSDRLTSLAHAAGLRTERITPAVVALARSGAAPTGWNLSISEAGVELFTETSAGFQLRHLGSPGSAWTGSLRRALHSGAARPEAVALWAQPPVDEATRAALLQSLGTTRLVIQDGPVSGDAAAAVAVSSAIAPDFMVPRLQPPRTQPRLLGRSRLVAAIVAALVLLALALLARSTLHANQEVADLEAQLNHIAPAVASAGPRVTSLRFARTFRTDGLRFLPCLGDLTLSVPADQQTYLTAFALQRNMDGVISGRARTAPQVLSLLDQLSTSGRFGKLHCRLDNSRRGGRAGPGVTGESGVSFEMSFAYQPQHGGNSAAVVGTR